MNGDSDFGRKSPGSKDDDDMNDEERRALIINNDRYRAMIDDLKMFPGLPGHNPGSFFPYFYPQAFYPGGPSSGAHQLPFFLPPAAAGAGSNPAASGGSPQLPMPFFGSPFGSALPSTSSGAVPPIGGGLPAINPGLFFNAQLTLAAGLGYRNLNDRMMRVFNGESQLAAFAKKHRFAPYNLPFGNPETASLFGEAAHHRAPPAPGGLSPTIAGGPPVSSSSSLPAPVPIAPVPTVPPPLKSAVSPEPGRDASVLSRNSSAAGSPPVVPNELRNIENMVNGLERRKEGGITPIVPIPTIPLSAPSLQTLPPPTLSPVRPTPVQVE